jgi:gluconate 2-dehydrogenase alpha chain
VTERSETEVLIVGLGAAGGIAADVLTSAGIPVTALEAGPRLRPEQFEFDELHSDVHAWMSQPKALGERPSWRATDRDEAGAAPWPTLMVNAVGGSTVHYPGLSARFQPWNFNSASATRDRYGDGAIPAGATLVDWPLDYDDLEPYYDRVERAIGVSGSGGHFDAPRSRGYPMPPLRRTGWTELTARAARSEGWHPFPAPAAINSVPYNGNPECTYCGFCSGNGCYRGAKGSAELTVIPRAEATGLLRVETGARVTSIEVDRDRLASGARYVKDGLEHFIAARTVLLCAFVYENTRLLLLSRSPAYPHGIANSAGQVGRHYMAHITPFAFGLFPGCRLHLFTGPWSQATCVEDFNADNFDHAGLGFVGGATLTAAHELKPIAAASAPLPASVPRWGTGWKAWLRANAQSIGSVGAQCESLSYEDNRLDLDPVRTDPSGLPVVRVTHRIHENEERSAAFMLGRLHEWLRAAGASETWQPREPMVEARHCYGGTRMGDDPASSVVDRFGFAHEVPNLGVLGASTFPTTGGINPTLTLQALAWRTADELAARLGGRRAERSETDMIGKAI